MAWTAPRTWVAGELVTAALLNTHLRDNFTTVRTGGIAVTSQATEDLLVASSSTALERLSGSSKVANLADAVLQRPELKDYAETRTAPTISGGTLTLDMANGNHFEVALNANITTLNLNNPPASGKAGAMVVAFKADGTVRTITWPAAVQWPSGNAPTMTGTNNEVDVITLLTYDAGTTWYAFAAGQAFS